MSASRASSVGIRELKSSLSGYIRRASRGEAIVITDRGRPVARLIGAGVPPGLARLVEKGQLRWAGHKPAVSKQRPVVRAGTVSDRVIEDRG